jgi:hypothetical protein
MQNNINTDLLGIICEMDGTSSGSCPMVGFGISGVEPLSSAVKVLVG